MGGGRGATRASGTAVDRERGHLGRRGDRVASLLVRELLFLSIAALGSWLFLNHDLLYLRGDFRPSSAPMSALILATLVLYGFLRAVTLVERIRPPTIRDGVAVCPECGQTIEDDSPIAHDFHVPPISSQARPTHAASALGAAMPRPVPTSLPGNLDLTMFADLFDEIENDAPSVGEVDSAPRGRDPIPANRGRHSLSTQTRGAARRSVTKGFSKKP